MPNRVYDYTWLCSCGAENHPAIIHCVTCCRQRWANLGFDVDKVLYVLSRLLPAYLWHRITV